MEFKIFYSWQSDIKAAANRTFIEKALKDAIKEIKSDDLLKVEPVIDRDTKDESGSPDIVDTIFNKIDECKVFIADVTIINSHIRPKKNNRLTPNPNVLVELGYAFKHLGFEKIILVQNTVFGSPNDLPFDLSHRRIQTYSSPEETDSRSEDRKILKNKLKNEIGTIVGLNLIKEKIKDACIVLKYRISTKTSKKHVYKLKINLVNNSTKTLKDWHVDLLFPKELLNPAYKMINYYVGEQNDNYIKYRIKEDISIYPEDNKELYEIDYIVDDQIFHKSDIYFNKDVIVKLYVDDELVFEDSRKIREFQNF